jgi:hypothetical protein
MRRASAVLGSEAEQQCDQRRRSSNWPIAAIDAKIAFVTAIERS